MLAHQKEVPVHQSSDPKEEREEMCLLQCCYSCHLKVIVDKMVPRCLQSQGRGDGLAARGAETSRQLTLEEIMYPPLSWEVEGTPARRNSPKVCPVNLDEFSDEDRSEGGYSAAAVDESVSAVSRASVRTQHGVHRRVSFRSPDESDVFIIPARRDSDDGYDDDESSDGEPPRRM